MFLASSVSCLFKWRQFEPEVILLAVGWYLRFSLPYRDVEGVARRARPARRSRHGCGRGYSGTRPELERGLRSRLKETNDSWPSGL
jgi:transposase-like protein